MQTRGLAGEDSVEGGALSNLKGLFAVIKTDPVFLTLGV